jgi:1,4-alpha-glucan branching enzyme
MTKSKNTKAKAPAPAKVVSEIAQPITAKPVKQPAKTKAKAKAPAAVAPVQAAKPVEVASAAPITPKIRLEISKPGAHSVAVAGSFNSWQPEQASNTGNGGWVKELTVGPGRYEYMLVVDGQWMADPNAKEYAPNPFGGHNSVLVV